MSQKRRVGHALGLSLALTILATSVASAGSIVPGVSIDGVRLLQSRATVRRNLGAPPVTHKVRSDLIRYVYPAHNNLNVFLLNGRVVRVYVTALPGQRVRDHTSNGIGLLSRMSAARAAYPGHCSKTYADAPPVCTWQTSDAFIIFKTSGRFGLGWKAPVESIDLQLEGPPPS